jgi:aryl-alcohol dehydrogenase-like predicted oxidoreductase
LLENNPGLSRIWWERYFGEKTKDTTVKKLNQLNEIAKELGCSLATLAMSWVIRNRDVSTAITSATKEE